MSLLKKLANWDDPASLSNRLRSRRIEQFAMLVSALPRPIRLIDIGATAAFWQVHGRLDRFEGVQVTVVNLMDQTSSSSRVVCVKGDATDLSQFSDQSFEVAFSNSVIEHVGGWAQQEQMASEVRRAAAAFWVQTPNYWFPMEPHFLFPGWQWIPESVRASILQRTAVGWNGRCPDRERALAVVRDAQLLSRCEMRRLFPDATIVAERFMGLAKSWVAISGFPESDA